jgi:predicted amidohydrolase YtcJ
MPGLVIRDAEVAALQTDLRVERGSIAALGRGLEAQRGDLVLEARGGALLPGLHDHHLHLLSWAAALGSLRCGPPAVSSEPALAETLAAASARGRDWLRGVGYHESVAGLLDRDRLDAGLGPSAPRSAPRAHSGS